MSNKRFDARRDSNEKEVVEALERAGWAVCRDLPVDLIAFKRTGRMIHVKLLEVKVKGKKPRKDQWKQTEFCEKWCVPKVTDGFEALLAVGEKIEL